jgi:uncharacterized membrane protein YccC
MATCPRCLGALTDGHKCRPIWIKRLRRQAVATFLGGLLGAFIHILVAPQHLPIMGFVIGGLFFFGLNEAVRPE